MKQMEPSVVLKYCQGMDEFIKIRVFTEEESADLLRQTQAPSKRQFIQLVVNACILHYHDQVLPMAKLKIASDQIEELLYPYCVEVNPQFDLHKVEIPVVQAEIQGALHLLEDLQRSATQSRKDRFLRLESKLREQVIGQEDAIRTVTQSLQRAAAGIRDPARPIGSFLFIGQTGVGKTELAKALARSVYDDPAKLIRIDCSEYSMPHEYAKLIGAPPGYIGHDEGGVLTEALKRRKEGVVLFDEIEKADWKVHNLLLQMLDEGFITDSKGIRVPFNECVIILTSNLGVRLIQETVNRAGFDCARRQEISRKDRVQATTKAIQSFFRPEMINRLDETVIFNSLDTKDIEAICALMLAEVARHAKRVGLNVQFDPKVRRHLSREGYKPEYGARELRRTVEKLVETPLSAKILEGRFREGDRVRVNLLKGSIHFQSQKTA